MWQWKYVVLYHRHVVRAVIASVLLQDCAPYCAPPAITGRLDCKDEDKWNGFTWLGAWIRVPRATRFISNPYTALHCTVQYRTGVKMKVLKMTCGLGGRNQKQGTWYEGQWIKLGVLNLLKATSRAQYLELGQERSVHLLDIKCGTTMFNKIRSSVFNKAWHNSNKQSSTAPWEPSAKRELATSKSK